jgi:hypothetical protein
MKKNWFKLLILLNIVVFTPACVVLKPYERIYVNDPEMQMGTDAGKSFTNYVHSVRGGYTPSGTNQTSGGCGCK